ncbi:MAG TPA: hypothetical protein VFA07_07075 [Chthonomonadaceae bacterium]|nr:hypothetical protein [Chthonomonadaceae bacterium]
MQRKNRFIAAALATAFLGSTLALPLAASASEDGHRNTAIGLGALAAGLLLTQRNKLPGILAAGGAAYAYSQYERDMVARHRRERAHAYRLGFRRGESYARYYRSRRHYSRHYRR